MHRGRGSIGNGSRLRLPAWIAGLALAALFLPAGASAWHLAGQPQAASQVQLSQHVPEVRQRCRWIKRCETTFEHQERCQPSQQCQFGHCMPVQHCYDTTVPRQTCYPQRVCRP
jgi:hypothetical protein